MLRVYSCVVWSQLSSVRAWARHERWSLRGEHAFPTTNPSKKAPGHWRALEVPIFFAGSRQGIPIRKKHYLAWHEIDWRLVRRRAPITHTPCCCISVTAGATRQSKEWATSWSWRWWFQFAGAGRKGRVGHTKMAEAPSESNEPLGAPKADCASREPHAVDSSGKTMEKERL
jgi:hypothetical protein